MVDCHPSLGGSPSLYEYFVQHEVQYLYAQVATRYLVCTKVGGVGMGAFHGFLRGNRCGSSRVWRFPIWNSPQARLVYWPFLFHLTFRNRPSSFAYTRYSAERDQAVVTCEAVSQELALSCRTQRWGRNNYGDPHSALQSLCFVEYLRVQGFSSLEQIFHACGALGQGNDQRASYGVCYSLD